MQSSANQTQDNSVAHRQGEEAKTLALAKRKHDAFLEDAALLSDIASQHHIADVSNPDKFMDQDISSLMQKVSGWKANLKDLTKSFNTFLELTTTHRLSESLMDAIELDMETVRNAVNDLIDAIEKEDKDRNIRALDHSRQSRENLKNFLVQLVKIFCSSKKTLKKMSLPTE